MFAPFVRELIFLSVSHKHAIIIYLERGCEADAPSEARRPLASPSPCGAVAAVAWFLVAPAD
eukprot:11154445-Lingulodinium_polyedra.AAC.1